MFERLNIASKSKSSTALVFQYADCFMAGGIPEFTQPSSYQKGLEDGRRNMEVELIKMGKALYTHAFQKIESVCNEIISFAESEDIGVIEIHLKVDNWDCSHSLIIVKLEDYLDDKIDLLYNEAHKLSERINDDNFHWDYSITYLSDSINKDKLVSDGFNFFYEHSLRTRQA